MGIFNRRGGEKADRAAEQGAGKSNWDNMDAVPFSGGRNQEAAKSQEQLDAERQQRKIIAALYGARDGHVDTEAFKYHDVQLNDGVRSVVLDRISDGTITPDLEDDLIDGIRGPLQYNHGSEKVMNDLNTRHEMRILTSMAGAGFDKWQTANPHDLERFVALYPNPRSFEEQSAKFLDMIKTANSDAKYREYVAAMDNFKHKVYGKKQEYWDQIQELHVQASEKTYNSRMGRIAREQADRRQQRPRSAEVERSSEWMPGEAGYWQTSRMQAGNGMVTRENIERGLWADQSCEDSMFVRPDQNMYGVFDGAGGHEGGRLASQLTASVVRECSNRYALESASSLAYVLNVANERVTNCEGAGLSTAVLTKVVERNGQKILAYASVGDSRIYIVDKDGNARQITRDEGEGRYIYNAIGQGVESGQSRTQQFGEEFLRKGDRVVLCSDGVTGDYGGDLMDPRELGFLVSHSRNALDASKNLLANARKRDDRTAIVFGEY